MVGSLSKEQIKQLQQTLRSGHTRLNWNTLGIKEYVAKCEKMIDKFESLTNQIHDIAKDIGGRVQMIADSNLFVYSSPDGEIPDVKTYFEVIERNRNRDFELLARKYRAMGPLLTKMEGLVVATNSGRSEKMANYYRYWERKMYDGIYTAIMSNLQNFEARLKKSEPLFYIEAMMNSQDRS